MSGLRTIACLVFVALASCRTAPSTEPPPANAPVDVPTATPIETAEAEEPRNETEDAPSKSAASRPAGSVEPAVAAFLEAANREERGGVEEMSTRECLVDECGGFAKQAGLEFQAVLVGKVEQRDSRAVATVDIMCGPRKCDLVYLLMDGSSDRWLVADVIEDDERMRAWLAGER